MSASLATATPGRSTPSAVAANCLGMVVLILDICKAAIPVGIAYHQLDIRGLPMVLIAIAPVLGHAFSPFLKFKGGKAIGTVLGSLIGVSLWQISLPAVHWRRPGHRLSHHHRLGDRGGGNLWHVGDFHLVPGPAVLLCTAECVPHPVLDAAR